MMENNDDGHESLPAHDAHVPGSIHGNTSIREDSPTSMDDVHRSIHKKHDEDTTTSEHYSYSEQGEEKLLPSIDSFGGGSDSGHDSLTVSALSAVAQPSDDEADHRTLLSLTDDPEEEEEEDREGHVADGGESDNNPPLLNLRPLDSHDGLDREVDDAAANPNSLQLPGVVPGEGHHHHHHPMTLRRSGTTTSSISSMSVVYAPTDTTASAGGASLGDEGMESSVGDDDDTGHLPVGEESDVDGMMALEDGRSLRGDASLSNSSRIGIGVGLRHRHPHLRLPHHIKMMGGVKNIMPQTIRSATERRLGCVLDGWYRRFGYKVANPRHPAVTVEMRRMWTGAGGDNSDLSTLNSSKIGYVSSSSCGNTGGSQRKGSEGISDKEERSSTAQTDPNHLTHTHAHASASSSSPGGTHNREGDNNGDSGSCHHPLSGILPPSSSLHHHLQHPHNASTTSLGSPHSSANSRHSQPHPHKTPACHAAFLARKSHLINLLREFQRDPPFTLQRVAEVLLNPEQYYTLTHKLCNGLEKLLGVTGTMPIDKFVQTQNSNIMAADGISGKGDNVAGGIFAQEESDVRRRRREIRENAALADERGREQQRRFRRRKSTSCSSIDSNKSASGGLLASGSNVSAGYSSGGGVGGSSGVSSGGHYKMRHRQGMARQHQVAMAHMAESIQRTNNRPSSPPHPSQASTTNDGVSTPRVPTFGPPNARLIPSRIKKISSSECKNASSKQKSSSCVGINIDQTEPPPPPLNETTLKLSPSPPSSPSHSGSIIRTTGGRTSSGRSSSWSSSRRRQMQQYYQHITTSQLLASSSQHPLSSSTITSSSSRNINNNSSRLTLSSHCRQQHNEMHNVEASITRTPSPILFARSSSSSNENQSTQQQQQRQQHHAGGPSSQRYDFDLDASPHAPSPASAAIHAAFGVVGLGNSEDPMLPEVLEVEACQTNSTLSSPSESSDDDSSDRSDKSDGSDGASGYGPFTAARVMALNRAQQQQRREQLLQSRALQRLRSRNEHYNMMPTMQEQGYQSGDSIGSTVAEDSGGSDSSSSSIND